MTESKQALARLYEHHSSHQHWKCNSWKLAALKFQLLEQAVMCIQKIPGAKGCSLHTLVSKGQEGLILPVTLCSSLPLALSCTKVLIFTPWTLPAFYFSQAHWMLLGIQSFSSSWLLAHPVPLLLPLPQIWVSLELPQWFGTFHSGTSQGGIREGKLPCLKEVCGGCQSFLILKDQ